MFCGIVDVTLNGTAVYNTDPNGYSIAVVPFGEHNQPGDMLLALSDVKANRNIIELDFNGTSTEEIFKPLGSDFFTVTDQESSLSVAGNSYTFPWIVNGKYHKNGNQTVI